MRVAHWECSSPQSGGELGGRVGRGGLAQTVRSLERGAGRGQREGQGLPTWGAEAKSGRRAAQAAGAQGGYGMGRAHPVWGSEPRKGKEGAWPG